MREEYTDRVTREKIAKKQAEYASNLNIANLKVQNQAVKKLQYGAMILDPTTLDFLDLKKKKNITPSASSASRGQGNISLGVPRI